MIAIVDYGLGNLASVLNMLRRVGGDAMVTSSPAAIRSASKLILPGVGAFDAGMRNIRTRGLESILQEMALERRVPVLGVCLGMQLLSHFSSEGIEPGLGWLDAHTLKIEPDSAFPQLRLPHMGWNRVQVVNPAHPLLADSAPPEPRYYFAHSYHVVCRDPGDIVATVTHGAVMTAIVGKGNIMGTQFHPEKSHRFGMALLANFVART